MYVLFHEHFNSAMMATFGSYAYGLFDDKRKGEMLDNEKKEYEKLLREKYRIQKDRRMYDPPPAHNPDKQSLLDIGRRRD